jgi:hypothetical protein
VVLAAIGAAVGGWMSGIGAAVGGWMSGIGDIAMLLAAAIAPLTWRSLRRRSPARCALPRQCHDSRAL